MDFPEVTIDDECELRLLPPGARGRSTGRVEQCQLLVSSVYVVACRKLMRNLKERMFCLSHKSHLATHTLQCPNTEMREFQTTMASLHSDMRRLAKDTERQKLKAIGRRARLEHYSSQEALRKEEALLLSKVADREKDMADLCSYEQSLERAEAEQLAELEKSKARRSQR